MKITLLVILGFSILAICLAVKGKKNSQDLENPTSNEPETSKSDANKSGGETSEADKSLGRNKKSPNAKRNAATADSSKSNKSTKPAPSKQPKKATQSEVDDTDITIDADDILKDDDDDEEDDDDEVVIPAPDDLDTETDPIELAEKIRNVADKEKRKELIDELRSAKDENEHIIPQGKFYAAAFAALNPKNIKRAETFWKNQLKRAISKAENAEGKNMKAGLGNAFGNAQKLVQAGPVCIALRRGEAVLLSTLSDTLKNFGKVSDLGHDAVGNISRFVRAATFPVDFIPIIKDIKNNVHDLIEEQAERGKYLSGSFAENGSVAFANAAKDADRKADQREALLKRQFSSKRTLL